MLAIIPFGHEVGGHGSGNARQGGATRAQRCFGRSVRLAIGMVVGIEPRFSLRFVDETQAESWLDSDYHADCEADTSPEASLGAGRAALASIPGTMTADFVAERDDR